MAKFVRYGPAPRYGMPEAGFCASSFVLVRRGAKVLAGIPRKHSKWTKEWAPNWLVYDKDRMVDEFQSWRLPASYLYEGEGPDAAARRVLRDQLRIRGTDLGRCLCCSFYDPSSWFPGRKHYDLCFVYEVRGVTPNATPPWWQRLEFVDAKVLKNEDLGSGMNDLVKVLRF